MSIRAITLALVVAPLFAAVAPPSLASDPIGIYTVVDRVKFEPAGAAAKDAERILIWGSFAFAPEAGGGDVYDAPVRGYLYYHLNEGQEEAARLEWADFARLAGTPQIVGFSSRYEARGRVREAFAEPATPDAYVINFGLVKVDPARLSQSMLGLASFALPLAPANGVYNPEVDPLVLSARAILHPERVLEATYRFEFHGYGGETETSSLLEPGADDGIVRWAPGLRASESGVYSWTVTAVGDAWEGAPAYSSFSLDFIRGDANGDRVVTISDAVALLLHLFAAGPAPRPAAAGDANRSGDLEIGDAVYVLFQLFGSNGR